jgi:16S rRNA (adenine(1408)-N(1))-methyltransferase
LGIDPVAEAMARASRRAARSPARGGLPNALFVLASAQSQPPELCGRVDRVTVHLPWGSLLGGLLQADPDVVGGVARLLKPRGSLELLLPFEPRDRVGGSGAVDSAALLALRAPYRAFGLELELVRAATPEELRESGSRWARRLAHDGRRTIWKLLFLRC